MFCLQVSSGEIAPFSSIKLEIIWQPTIPGKVDSEFVISFSDPDSENVSTSRIFEIPYHDVLTFLLHYNILKYIYIYKDLFG